MLQTPSMVQAPNQSLSHFSEKHEVPSLKGIGFTGRLPPPGTKLHYVIPTNHSPISARNTKCPLWNAVVLQRQLHPPRGTTIARDVPVLSIPIPLENSTFHSRRKYQIRNSNISAMLVHVRSVNRYQVYTCEFSRKNEAPGNSTPA